MTDLMARPTHRAVLAAWVESARVQRFVVAVILLNGVVLGLQTGGDTSGGTWGPVLERLDTACLGIFVVELSLKLYAHGWRFFRSGWNVFDLVIVGIALVPATGALSVLRTLRILRVLRLVSTMPRLRFVVESLMRALPGMASIGGLLLLVFYVGAVIATNLFGEEFPQWFGSLGASFFSLFQIMTLESWSMGIVRPVMEVFPWAWAFFVPFILLSAFTVLNLFIAVIVDSMQTLRAHDDEEAALADAPVDAPVDEPADRDAQVAAVQARLDEAVVLLRELSRRDSVGPSA
ncbi:ion transporter [Nocardioides sp.]|uniref:ion transporter n=1 Tax=Nocardioides sp. TaxID=35761 RepID=UPI0027371881|nr:ion transporter [Nocardioides sp.]MDP3894437.1 ion transporter [Nocardioides sp.]